MIPTFVILSGAYIGSELVAEFGRLPPSFLPNGVARVFEQQVALATRHASRTFITLPEGFTPSETDLKLLADAQVEIIWSDPKLSLPNAVGHALDIAQPEGRLFVLFGDTIVDFGAAGSAPDTFATGETRHFAVWADFVEEEGRVRFHEGLPTAGAQREVVAGFFDFSDGKAFREALRGSNSFFGALNAYCAHRPLTPARAARWLDFGHLHTYYQSRRNELAARAFNRVTSHGLTVRKTGTPARKIYAEAAWYQALPAEFRPFVPHLIAVHQTPEISYEIEYLYLPATSEIFVFGALPRELWALIVSSCREFLELCQGSLPKDFEIPADYAPYFFRSVVVEKTYERIQAFAKAEGLSLDEAWTVNGKPAKSLNEVVATLIKTVGVTQHDDLCLWHGDFHFANIFFDFRSQRIKTVDPRGMLPDGGLALYGDARYDVAKLAHSVVGLYDFIVAGRYRLDMSRPYQVDLAIDVPENLQGVVEDFLKLQVGGYDCGSPQILALTALLYFSMLPLHNDDRRRQYAMLANAYRLAHLAEQAA